MNWKEFLKPTVKKVVVFILLLFVASGNLVSLFLTMGNPLGNFLSGMIFFMFALGRCIISLDFICIVPSIIAIFLVYLLTCMIFSIYSNARWREFLRLNFKKMIIFIITGSVLSLVFLRCNCDLKNQIEFIIGFVTNPFTLTVLIIIILIPSYILSCLIVWIYEKVKKK